MDVQGKIQQTITSRRVPLILRVTQQEGYIFYPKFFNLKKMPRGQQGSVKVAFSSQRHRGPMAYVVQGQKTEEP